MSINVVDTPDAALAVLSPLRRRILAELVEPASASRIADALGLARQKVNYHMTILERHGFIELAEERPRRGLTERVFRRVGNTVVVPDIVEATAPTDDMSAEAVVAAATDAIRAIGALERGGSAHPTATLTTEVAFASPAAHRQFLEKVAELVAEYDAPSSDGALRFKVTVLSHVTEGVGG